jgi:hypothetical protein
VLNNLGKLCNIINKNSWNKITNAFPPLQTSFCCICIIWSLPTKKPNNLNELFSHLLRSHWTLSPSKYSPPLFIYHSQCFFQFWKHSWNASFRILRSSASKFSLISSTNSNYPFSTDFRLVKKKKSAGARFGECRGWGTSIVSCLVTESWIRGEECAGTSSWSSNHPLLIAEKYAKQARQTFILTDTAQGLS